MAQQQLETPPQLAEQPPTTNSPNLADVIAQAREAGMSDIDMYQQLHGRRINPSPLHGPGFVMQPGETLEEGRLRGLQEWVGNTIQPGETRETTDQAGNLGARLLAYHGGGPPRVLERQLYGNPPVPAMVDVTPMSVENYSKMVGAQRDRDIGQASLMQGKASLLEAKKPPGGGALPAVAENAIFQAQIDAMKPTSNLPVDEEGTAIGTKKWISNLELSKEQRYVARELAKRHGRPLEGLPDPEGVDKDALRVLLDNPSRRKEAFDLLDQGDTKVSEWLKSLAELPGGKALATEREKTLVGPTWFSRLLQNRTPSAQIKMEIERQRRQRNPFDIPE